MKVLGAILAGGKSVRFGSDKAIATFKGLPLIEHAAASLMPQCDALVIAGRPHATLTSVADYPAPDMGPLAGLAGALRFARASGFDHVLSIGVDSLLIPGDLRRALEPAPAYVTNQPVIGLWPVTAFTILEQILCNDGRHSMIHFIKTIGARAAILESPPMNVNTRDDLEGLIDTA
jgi:molybdopterin-guanine dinucleotide biosynthesis protein A